MMCCVSMATVLCPQHETIEHMLERGQKLDDLVQKTDKLSGTSKAFYKEVYSVHVAPLLLVTVAAFSVISCRPEEGRVVSYSDFKSFFNLLFVCFAKKLGLVTREERVIGGWGLVSFFLR